MSLLQEAGTLQKDCREFTQVQSSQWGGRHKNPTRSPKKERQTSQNAMVISDALEVWSRTDWIMDSGATSDMCNDRSVFTPLEQLGCGNTLHVAGEGTVDVAILQDGGIRRRCTLNKVLYVPGLAYNFVSAPRTGDAEKTVHFDDSSCEFQNANDEVIAIGE